jgi:hypothetical protein
MVDASVTVRETSTRWVAMLGIALQNCTASAPHTVDPTARALIRDTVSLNYVPQEHITIRQPEEYYFFPLAVPLRGPASAGEPALGGPAIVALKRLSGTWNGEAAM